MPKPGSASEFASRLTASMGRAHLLLEGCFERTSTARRSGRARPEACARSVRGEAGIVGVSQRAISDSRLLLRRAGPDHG